MEALTQNGGSGHGHDRQHASRDSGAARAASGDHRNRSPYLTATTTPDAVHDLICVGFGPASLAIAVALHDALENGSITEPPKVLFLERQKSFAWHAGMLLPGAKMQISFIKDLATLRDPRSNFTFLNYLHSQGRLVEFINLNTFLPARIEYEDYLSWCASFFDDVVRYGSEVLHVSRDDASSGEALVDTFKVVSRHPESGAIQTHRSRNVILAIGGQPSIPRCLPADDPRVIHSSQYSYLVPKILSDPSKPYRVAVVGAGQSAAEIFNNIQVLYPNSRTWLVMRSEFLKPSDDSPFVNSIFNPEYVDLLFPMSAKYRQNLLTESRATNYGVVRLELIETLYERMYHQRRVLGSDERRWPHRIMGGRSVSRVEEGPDGLRLHLERVRSGEATKTEAPPEAAPAPAVEDEEVLDVDLIIAATGYRRSSHVDMLQDLWPLLPEKKGKAGEEDSTYRRADRWEVKCDTTDAEGHASTSTKVLQVARDYQVQFSPRTVAPGSGIWLQGCCEGTHGLSDTLLSVLATRSGEIVESLFGPRPGERG